MSSSGMAGTRLVALHPTRNDVLATAAGDTITFWRLGATPVVPAWRLIG